MNYLIVAAHPDDEVLGAGGTIQKLSKQGDDVKVCILCSKAEARSKRPEKEQLEKDLRRSMESLGVTKIYEGNFRDSELNTYSHLDIVRFIEGAIIDSKADHIITHHPNDMHNDHRITSECCQEAARLSMRMIKNVPPLKSMWYMEVPSSTDWSFNSTLNEFRPNIFVEIGKDGVEKKIKALEKYRDVMRPFPHPRCEEILKSFAAYRGGQSGCKYAEAFEAVFVRL